MTTTELQIRRLFAAFPERDISPATVAVYTERLATLDPALLALAIDTVLDETTDFFPRIGAIKQAAWRHIAPADEMDGLRWAVRQLNRIGGYSATGAFIEPVEYPDTVTRETIRLISWARLANESPDWVHKTWREQWQRATELVSKQFLSGELTAPELTLGAANESRPNLKAIA